MAPAPPRRAGAARGPPRRPPWSAALVDDASLHLARWAKEAGVALPVQLGFDLLLVGTSGGLGLWASDPPRRAPRRLAVVPWDDVALRAGCRSSSGAASSGAGLLVLTMRGPGSSRYARSVPRARTAREVVMLGCSGSVPVTGPDAVEAVVAHLTGAVRASR